MLGWERGVLHVLYQAKRKGERSVPSCMYFRGSKRLLFTETSSLFSQFRDDFPGRRMSVSDSMQFLSPDVEGEWFEKNHSPSYPELKIGSSVDWIEHLQMPMELYRDFIDICKVAFSINSALLILIDRPSLLFSYFYPKCCCLSWNVCSVAAP